MTSRESVKADEIRREFVAMLELRNIAEVMADRRVNPVHQFGVEEVLKQDEAAFVELRLHHRQIT